MEITARGDCRLLSVVYESKRQLSPNPCAFGWSRCSKHSIRARFCSTDRPQKARGTQRKIDDDDQTAGTHHWPKSGRRPRTFLEKQQEMSKTARASGMIGIRFKTARQLACPPTVHSRLPAAARRSSTAMAAVHSTGSRRIRSRRLHSRSHGSC